MNEQRKVSVEGDKQFTPWKADSTACERGTPTENWAHDMEAVEVSEGGPTVIYCRRGCGLTQRFEQS